MSFSFRRDVITKPIFAWAHKALPPAHWGYLAAVFGELLCCQQLRGLGFVPYSVCGYVAGFDQLLCSGCAVLPAYVGRRYGVYGGIFRDAVAVAGDVVGWPDASGSSEARAVVVDIHLKSRLKPVILSEI